MLWSARDCNIGRERDDRPRARRLLPSARLTPSGRPSKNGGFVTEKLLHVLLD